VRTQEAAPRVGFGDPSGRIDHAPPAAPGNGAARSRQGDEEVRGWRRIVRRELLFVLGASLVLVVDQVTKALATAYLKPAGSVPVTGWLHLTYLENRGAAFGVLQNQTVFFILVGLIVAGGLIASYRYLPTATPLLNLGLGLQLGGALGNLVDRVRQGYVVDFVDLSWWPVFNVADAAIMIGVGVLAYYWVSSARPADSLGTSR
jgi:signal peptidase II